ncbi:cell wall-binding repeat-containing protein [Euzebya tangerina]|uniref:cell wall-binding repeat-containing protein n=1 Tax=Euzebya tangerina TaxID=591198 RepID=UPI002F2D8056
MDRRRPAARRVVRGVLAVLLTLMAIGVGSAQAASAGLELTPGLQTPVIPPAAAPPSYAVAACIADPPADTVRGDGRREVVPEADVTEFCLDYGPDGLAVAVTVPAGTDPALDPTWDDFGASIGVLYDSVAGQPREIQLSTQGSTDELRYLVLEGRADPTLICEGSASFDDGVYAAQVLTACLNAPEVLRALGRMAYGIAAGPDGLVIDDVPGDGGFVDIPLVAPEGADRVTRLAGPTRIETAVATSQASFADGQADGVLIALADNYPDALVAAPLAVARNAPILLSFADDVPAGTRAEALRALGGPGSVTLLGGTAALSDTVVEILREDGHAVTRVAGDSRFSTSVAVAEASTSEPSTIWLAFGGNYPDALLAGAAAPPTDGVAVLVDGAGIPGVVQAYLDAHPAAEVVAVGPVAARWAPTGADRVSDLTPSATSALLLRRQGAGGELPVEVTVASADDFPDGLTGGAYAARRGVPLLLSPRDVLEASITTVLAGEEPLQQVTLFGGTAALSDVVAGQLAAYLVD